MLAENTTSLGGQYESFATGVLEIDRTSVAGVRLPLVPLNHVPAAIAPAIPHRLGANLVAPAGNRTASYQISKRAFDVVGSLALIVVLSPVLLVTWLVLMVTTRGKPIFAQERLGLCGRPFTIYKFRTMAFNAAERQAEVENEKDGPIFKNRRDPRITRIGRWLRMTSIDEMPQLFNVFRGDMSLVGPRPPLAKEVAQYERRQLRRLAVKPGLTCLWQVSGRSEIGFEDWIRMDLWYLANQNFWTDLGLLVRTPWCVLTGRGAY
jgi:lipopolysaccharide/colanic/teichoic acid biosynthesis glycosyltransferase